MPKIKRGQGTKNKAKARKIYTPKPKRKRDKGFSRTV